MPSQLELFPPGLLQRRLIDKRKVAARLDCSLSSLYRNFISRPDFPKPVKAMPGKDLYAADEIDAFCDKLLAEREQ